MTKRFESVAKLCNRVKISIEYFRKIMVSDHFLLCFYWY